jgi:hypothetical protein
VPHHEEPDVDLESDARPAARRPRTDLTGVRALTEIGRRTLAPMDVVVSPEARRFAAGRGGIVYVRSHSHRCCAGPLTLLDTTTEAPTDAGAFVDLPAGDLTVRYCGDPEAGPHVLTIALRGSFRRRLVSYWDGCAFKP